MVPPLRCDVHLRAPASPYQLAIFDFDGTLADSFPRFLAAINDAAARFGFHGLDPRDVEELRGRSSWQIMEHMEIAMWQVPMITQFVRSHMAANLEGISLFPGVPAMLEALSARGVQLSVVSSNSEPSIRRVLGEHAALIGCYRCNVSIFGKRPRFRQALAMCGVQPAAAIAIGDEIRDLRAAKAEGIAFGGVAWGFTAVDALAAEEPDVMFDRVEDITALFTERIAAGRGAH